LTFPEAVMRLANGGAKQMDKKVEAVRTHPAAEAYRLMEAGELEELAASIKAHGLRDPITVGIIGGERWIVDGRNRERACEITGVQAEYEMIEFRDEDALRAFVADRNERRNITSGQKAMAHAMLFPEAKHTGRGNKMSGKPDNLGTGHWKNLVSQARAVLAHSEPMAIRVRDGFPLSEAFEQAKAERAAALSDEARKERLRDQGPDLLSLVEEGRMTIAEAIAALVQRQAEAEAVERSKRDTFIRLVEGAYRSLPAFANEEFVAGFRQRLADEPFRRTVLDRLLIDKEPSQLEADIHDGSVAFALLVTEALNPSKKGDRS
jgi:hypothetical protein